MDLDLKRIYVARRCMGHGRMIVYIVYLYLHDYYDAYMLVPIYNENRQQKNRKEVKWRSEKGESRKKDCRQIVVPWAS